MQSFAEFWPHYCAHHRHPLTRALHHAGTLAAPAFVALAGGLGEAGWLVAAPLASYGLAWLGHFAVERNLPATFAHPLWSLRADIRMLREDGARLIRRGSG